MTKKIIFLDIDGTLVPGGTNVPPESAVRAIRAAQQNGHLVYLCTGRNMAMLSPLLAYGFDGVVASAGGYIQCGEKELYNHPMPTTQRDAALKVLHENGVSCLIETKDATYADANLTKFLADEVTGQENSEMQRWKRAMQEDLGVRPMQEYHDEPVYKLVMMFKDEAQMAAPRAALEREFNFCMQGTSMSGDLNGELINRAFDKGRAVSKVCAALGIPVEDSIAFGDSMNDYEMVQAAGIGIAMEDGSPALKAVADSVCPPVGQDGIAAAFAALHLV